MTNKKWVILQEIDEKEYEVIAICDTEREAHNLLYLVYEAVNPDYIYNVVSLSGLNEFINKERK